LDAERVIRIGSQWEVEMAEAVVTGFGTERAGRTASDAAPWRQAHEELVRLAATRAALDHEEGRWLLRAEQAGAHLRLGYGSFREYAERLFGYSSRLVQEKLRVAAALEELPRLSGALEHGRLSFSAVRELSRVATVATEGAWLDAAEGKSVRELEKLVSGQKPGSLPSDLPDEGARRHVLRLEVSGEVLATFREAMAKVRREAGETVDDDAAVLLLCRQALGGPRDDGRSSYQVALTVCQHCRRGMQQGRGELVEVPREIVEMSVCDAQDVGHIERAHVGAKRATQSVAPALRRRVTRRDGGRCRVPGCRHAVFTDVHHLRLRSEGGESTLANLVTLYSAHHRAIHRGELVVDGESSDGLDFRHADGTPYGELPSPVGAELRAKAYRALTVMGYRETEAKRALARLPSASGSLEQLVRQALRELATDAA
jgi:hypothetical protein